MIDLYNSTNGANWTRNTNWLDASGTDGQWFGIICNSSQTSIQRLQLGNNNLSGGIPSSIDNLSNLTLLDLPNNNISGSIPTSIGNLSTLTGLSLHNNNLSGSIPSSFGDLSNMGGFSLGDNNLSGSIPSSIGNMTNLVNIGLSNNNLSGSLPSSIGNLTQLRVVGISNNNLTGSIPSSICDLPLLSTLHLENNNLTGSFPSSIASPILSSLHLDNNNLSGSLPSSIGNITSLVGLRLHNNSFSGDIPSAIGNLTNLDVLFLSSNIFSGEIPSSFSGFKISSNIRLHWNALYTNDESLRSHLNRIHVGGIFDLETTQTIAPANVSVTALSGSSVQVSWTPILYTGDTGRYEVWSSTTNGGPYTLAGTTDNKNATNVTVTGLSPGTTYYLIVRTVTEAHSNNKNKIISEPSVELSIIGSGLVRTLSVASANPASGVPISISPADKDGAANGTTLFTRVFDDGTIVTLTAPDTVGGNNFQKWQRDGVDESTDKTTDVTMTADYTMTAVYVSPVMTRTLTVVSSNPNSGVAIAVRPSDRNGDSNGNTPFSRQYDGGASVTVTAPETAVGNTFKQWLRDGQLLSTDREINFSIDNDYTLSAVFASVRTLTVQSTNPGTNVSISVSPADRDGAGNGSTPFSRHYNDGTSITLSAPNTVGSNSFMEWLRDGLSVSTDTSVTFPVDADTTLTAVYSVPHITYSLTIASLNPSRGVRIDVNPADNNGDANGTTPFSRVYNPGTNVTLTAPNSRSGNPFIKWLRNNQDFAGNSSTNTVVNLDADQTLTAVYEVRPEIRILRPGSIASGSPSFELLVLGTGFVPGSMVTWERESRSTTFLSSKQLRARIYDSDIMTSGVACIQVQNPGGLTSDCFNFVVTSIRPYFCCTDPTSTIAGSEGDLTLAVYGNNFVPNSEFLWNGSPHQTQFLNRQKLEVTLPSSDLANPTTANVSVRNPDGSTSDPMTFDVIELDAGAPQITRISPEEFPVGMGGFQLTVFGSGFGSGSVIQFNKADKPTEFISNTELRCQINDSDIARASTYSVRVVNPNTAASAPNQSDPLLITGNEAVVVIVNPVPDIETFSPTSIVAGNTGISLSVQGSGFTPASLFRWNGIDLTPSLSSSSELSVSLPDSDLDSIDTAVFSISNPGPGGGASHAQTFSITTPTSAATTLFYPRLLSRRDDSPSTDNSESTGIAVVNLGSSESELTLRSLEPSGSETTRSDLTSPVSMTLDPGEQVPIVDSQLFGSGISDPAAVRWMKIESSQPETAGFFLSFNDTLDVLDGADVSSSTLTSFVLPEILVPDIQSEGLSTPDDEIGFTQIHVANPESSSATVTFHLHASNGSSRTSVSRTIAPGGTLALSLPDLFPGTAAEESDYILATSDQPVVPFQLLGKTGTFIHGLNGQDATATSTTLYSPQYVVGGSTWRSTLTVVNLDSTSGNVTFQFIGDDGTQIGVVRTLPIPASGKLYITDQTFFLDPGDLLTQGYVKITSDGPSLSGSVVFGDQQQSQFSAALPLVSTLLDDIIFGQVASNLLYFTGAAILNPGTSATTATIDVFDKDGALVVSTMRVIPAGQRTSMLLTQFFPELLELDITSGYIRITVDQKVASFALFGTNNLSVLSAVPPQVVP